ncbi:MAG: ATP-binding protein [Eubacteriales bacterium]|nr:ATP-binding protein [Eubacteriales bacterium]
MEHSEEWLAKYRVPGNCRLTCSVMEMTEDEKLTRRSYIRRTLKKYPAWCNLPNESIDQMTLRSIDGGYLVEDANGYEFLLRDAGVLKQEAEFRKARAMMPFEFMNLSGRDFDWTKYRADVSSERDIVNKYIMKYPQFRERGMGLYIYSGTRGSGKTMLSCCILNEISKRYSGSIKFVNAIDLLEMTKKGFYGSEDEIRALYEAALLVIDDIGVQLSREWTDTIFYRLINDRYANRRPTIYTSNMPAENLRMNDRITDRIESTTYLVSLPEEPIRKNTRQQAKKELLEKIEKGPDRCANTDKDQA